MAGQPTLHAVAMDIADLLASGVPVSHYVEQINCADADNIAERIDAADLSPEFLKTLGRKWIRSHRESYPHCTHGKGQTNG